MGKVIMVSEDVYENLKRIKKQGESFSDVIRRLLSHKPKLMDIAGSKTITKRDWEEVVKKFKVRDDLDEIRRRYLIEIIGGE
jgi:predicted CopG family antitoxin